MTIGKEHETFELPDLTTPRYSSRFSRVKNAAAPQEHWKCELLAQQFCTPTFLARRNSYFLQRALKGADFRNESSLTASHFGSLWRAVRGYCSAPGGHVIITNYGSRPSVCKSAIFSGGEKKFRLQLFQRWDPRGFIGRFCNFLPASSSLWHWKIPVVLFAAGYCSLIRSEASVRQPVNKGTFCFCRPCERR